jgi:hypothetical protein
VVLRRAGQEPRTFSHSSLAVGALTRDALARTRPGFEPVLSQRGAAYAFVLAACDGQRRLDAIEAQTHDAFPELFPSLGDAQAFVAGVIGRHTSPPQ